jgi:hypothetical protein
MKGTYEKNLLTIGADEGIKEFIEELKNND